MVSKKTNAQAKPGDALKELLIEVTLLHHHVAAVSRRLLSPRDLTNRQVSILRSLAAGDAATVPMLARERAIARQPMQRMVLDLESLGLVAFEDNPRHQRSRLIRLTPAGRRTLTSMEKRQSRLASAFGLNVSEKTLRSASRVLRMIRMEISKQAPDGIPR